MLMILPTTLVLGAIGYFFYRSKKEESPDKVPLSNNKEDDDLYRDLEDLYI